MKVSRRVYKTTWQKKKKKAKKKAKKNAGIYTLYYRAYRESEGPDMGKHERSDA